MKFFLHIPKTAGTTISHAIRTTLEWDDHLFVANPLDGLRIAALRAGEAPEYDVVHGHFHYGLIPAYSHSPQDDFIFTVLREPIARTLSAFSFITERFSSSLVAQGRGGWSISNHLYDDNNDSWFFADNLMVRFLIREWRDKRIPCTIADLEQAKAVLEEKIDFIAFTDDLSDFNEMILRVFGADLTGRVYNRTSRSLRLEDLDRGEADVIRQFNALDIELYNWALERRAGFAAKNRAAVDRVVAGTRSKTLRVMPGDDGPYLSLQNELDEKIASWNASRAELASREFLIEEMHGFAEQCDRTIRSSKPVFDALGGEIHALVPKLNELETQVLNNTFALQGRQEFVGKLRDRLAHLEALLDTASGAARPAAAPADPAGRMPVEPRRQEAADTVDDDTSPEWAQLARERDELEAGISRMEGLVKEGQSRLDVLREANEGRRRVYTSLLNARTATAEAIARELKDAQAFVESHQNAIVEIDRSVPALRSELETLKAEAASMIGRMDELGGEANALRAQIQRVSEAKTERADLIGLRERILGEIKKLLAEFR